MHPFDHTCPSDHRSIHLDIDLSSYYKETKQLHKYIPRGITSTNTINLKKYKQIVYDLMHSPSMKSAIDSIKKIRNQYTDNPQQRNYQYD